MVGLVILGLLWTLDNNPDLLSIIPFLWVEKEEKHIQTCEPKISEKHRCPDWNGTDMFLGNWCDTLHANGSISTVPPIWHNVLKIFEFIFYLLDSVCLYIPGKHSVVIVIFNFKRYCQISLLIVFTLWFWVPPSFLIKFCRAIIYPISLTLTLFLGFCPYSQRSLIIQYVLLFSSMKLKLTLLLPFLLKWLVLLHVFYGKYIKT